MRQTLKKRSFDFLLLQEVDSVTLEMIKQVINHKHYGLINTYNPKTNKLVNITLVYSKKFKLLDSDFISYSKLVVQQLHESGNLVGIFELPKELKVLFGKEKILVANTHLHASYRIAARRRELRAAKKHIHRLDPHDECVQVIGGDFNNLFYGERTFFDKFMLPHFINCTDFPDYTCDTKYIEHFYMPKRIHKVLGYFDLSWKTKIDHIYTDEATAKRVGYVSGTIDTEASDHKPVYVKFRKTKTKKRRIPMFILKFLRLFRFK
jgi:endonuclease/exonuclease/phosphatase family metal-dependent hydrolase